MARSGGVWRQLVRRTAVLNRRPPGAQQSQRRSQTHRWFPQSGPESSNSPRGERVILPLLLRVPNFYQSGQIKYQTIQLTTVHNLKPQKCCINTSLKSIKNWQPSVHISIYKSITVYFGRIYGTAQAMTWQPRSTVKMDYLHAQQNYCQDVEQSVEPV